MNENNRNDFSFDLWGTPLVYDKNKFYMDMNPNYGQGQMRGMSFDEGINTNIAKYKFQPKDDFKTTHTIKQFKEDLLYIGKILKGQYFIKEADGNHIVFKEGDIFCFVGNYYLDLKFYSEKETIILGIFGYKNEIIKSFIKKNWYTDRMNLVLNDEDLKRGIKLSSTDEMEELTNDLYQAINREDSYASFVKMMSIFYSFVSNYNKGYYKKNKSYTEEQLETVVEIKKFLDKNLDNYFSMPKISKMFNISLSRMQSIFKDYYSTSPYKYHLDKRLEKAKNLIINTDIKLGVIASNIGFSSYNKFWNAYNKKYNCNPSEHRKV